MIEKTQIKFGEIPKPNGYSKAKPINLTKETMESRCEKVLEKMKERNLDVLAIYADREHGGNFSYLTGFIPRFEEALLILHRNGKAFLLLGNEMLRMAKYSRICAQPLHVHQFSLPNQPTDGDFLDEALYQTGIGRTDRVGIVGWKLLNIKSEEDLISKLEVPYFIVHSIEQLAKDGNIEAATDLFLDPGYGVRATMNVNEIAHYEYGAALASRGMRKLLEKIEPGMTELELAGLLENDGQPNNIQTICAAGDRFTDAVVSPRNKKVCKGDRFTASVGYPGGLTNRAAYVVENGEELPESEKNYIDRVALPYFCAMASWYEAVGDGVSASEIYQLIEQVVPQEVYGWSLNPGHLTSEEEWLSSPFYPYSEISLKSGMALQMDLILRVPDYNGCNAEDGIVIMNFGMQKEMEWSYPQVWRRMKQRKKYMRDVLGITLKDEVFPMSDLCGYVRPFLLDKKRAFYIKKWQEERYELSRN